MLDGLRPGNLNYSSSFTLFAGLVNNAEGSVLQLLRQVADLVCHLSESRSSTAASGIEQRLTYGLLVLEGPSQDSTAQLLRRFMDLPLHCQTLGRTAFHYSKLLSITSNETGHATVPVTRLHWMAHLRSMLHAAISNYVRELGLMPSHVVMMDMEMPCFNLNGLSTLLRNRELLQHWSVLCYPHHPKDARHDVDCNDGFFDDVFALVFEDGVWAYAVWNDQVGSVRNALLGQQTLEERLSSLEPGELHIVPVNSCFNGLAIYKYSLFQSCKYQQISADLLVRTPNMEPYIVWDRAYAGSTCEHIAFNLCLREQQNAKIGLVLYKTLANDYRPWYLNRTNWCARHPRDHVLC